jgi:hypothetical protein
MDYKGREIIVIFHLLVNNSEKRRKIEDGKLSDAKKKKLIYVEI